MTSHRGSIGREVLPIPDQQFAGLVTSDAEDPATSFPPIEPLRPPSGTPNVLIVLIDDCGSAASERVRRPDQLPDRGAPGRRGSPLPPLPHDGALLPRRDHRRRQ